MVMEYINPDIESSYKENNLGKVLYDYVLQTQPKIIIEFGTLYGYSSACMAMALDELNNGGKIICYDLWEKYPYKHSIIEKTKQNLEKYNVSQYVEFKELNFKEWIPEDFDLLHVDISNDGNTIIELSIKCFNQLKQGKHILFEGGSIERDNIEWMIKYNKQPINSIKSIINYIVIDEKFPSISKLELK
jgi:predicted O-methyltransferase YrrM